MGDTFDQVSYWKNRHKKLRGDHRATGNISRPPEQMLQRKLVQAYFFSAVVQALAAEIFPRSGTQGSPSAGSTALDVLDIGFGTGFLGSLLTLAGFRYTGYDLSEVAVEDSAVMCPHANYSVQNIVDSAAPASDVIIASEVLFHIVDDRQWESALGNIRKGMRDTSILMFTETFVGAVKQGPPHFKPRTRAMYSEALGRNGLRFVRPEELLCGRMPVFNQYLTFNNSVHFVRPS